MIQRIHVPVPKRRVLAKLIDFSLQRIIVWMSTEEMGNVIEARVWNVELNLWGHSIEN